MSKNINKPKINCSAAVGIDTALNLSGRLRGIANIFDEGHYLRARKYLADIIQTLESCKKGTVPEDSSSEPDPDDDQVNHPSHYQSYNTALNIECIDAMRAAFGDEAVENFCICNAFKYVWRHQSKNGKQDIEKAIWYLNKYLELNK